MGTGRRDGLSGGDRTALARAREKLENPNLAVRLSNVVGRPIESAVAALPPRVGAVLATGTQRALEAALAVALSTLGGGRAEPSRWLHRGLALAAGAAGGAAGLAGLALELPVSTALLLRAIADHARAQGEDLALAEPRLECLAVFALGGRTRDDDAAEGGYLAARAALAKAVADAAEWLARRGLAAAAAERSAPALVRLVGRVAERFGARVAQKAAAQALPIVGALGGAAINAAFMEHYQSVAWGHFTVRRLERIHGAEAVHASHAAPGSRRTRRRRARRP